MVSIFYLIPQMVGAGKLIKPLLGIRDLTLNPPILGLSSISAHAIGVIAVGGGIGSVLRYLLARALPHAPEEFPTATLVTNLVGALLLETISRALDSSGTKVNFFSHPEMDFKTALVALSVLILCGVLASILPAAKAARVNPIVALQDE